MPSGSKVPDRIWHWALQLLRQSYRPGSELRRSKIPEICGIHRNTFHRIRDEAAIKWLEYCEDAERHDQLVDRGR